MMLKTIGLLGNPNCGKSTLFNALTGSQQRVGNWPGVTVERKSGSLKIGSDRLEVIDLPGIYSLDQSLGGMDEDIARKFVEAGECDLIVNIIDASNLERHLVLTQQLLDFQRPVVVALNMIDVAERAGLTVDPEALSKALGVPVIPMIASRSSGLEALLQHLSGASEAAALRDLPLSTSQPRRPPRQGEAEGSLEENRKRYHRAVEIGLGVTQVRQVMHQPSERIDQVVLNRWLGIPIFVGAMYLMFTVAINLGAVFIDFFDILFGAVFVTGSEQLLDYIGIPVWMSVLISQGLGGGIQLVATFIPVIGFLFLCLSIMEDSGYMARAAFVIDRLMISIGLPGSAFVPLIVGFGCNVPAVMATRTLSKENDRLMTIAMAPFMSCGARLTVYALFAAAFFEGQGQNIVFLLYLLGIIMAIFTGWVFRQQIFEDSMSESYAEMPVYHMPILKNLLLTTWFRLKSFILRAGRTIVLVVVALSFLNSLGSDGTFGHEDTEQSVLSEIGKTLTPAFYPMGLTDENWPATVGLFTGLFAKEAVVGTLDALYSGGADAETLSLAGSTEAAFISIYDNALSLTSSLTDPLGLALDPAEQAGNSSSTLTNMAEQFGTDLAAFSYLVFVLLYAPCVAVIAAMHKESGLKWACLVFGWTTFVGYVSATLIYQTGTLPEHPGSSLAWILGLTGLSAVVILALKVLGKKAMPTQLIPTVQVS